MGPSHVSALSPLILDGVPGLFGRPCCDYTETGNVHAVEGDMASHKLVSKGPFIVSWGAQVDWGTGSGLRRSQWCTRKWDRFRARFLDPSVNVS